MNAVKYLKEKHRMCQNTECSSCKFSESVNNTGLHCEYYVEAFPEEAVKIVKKWSKKHKIKTTLQDFKEKHPTAPLTSANLPKFCPHDVGYGKNEWCTGTRDECVKCWNREVE